MRKRLAAAYIGAVIGVPLGLLAISYGSLFVVEFLFLFSTIIVGVCVFFVAIYEISKP